MKMPMVGTVIQASRYDMDGNKGGAIHVTSKPTDESENRTGLDIMKMAASFETVEKLKGYLPCECDMLVEPVQGSGGKMSFKLLEITPKTKVKQSS